MLDTSTVILLSRVADAGLLPVEPLITAVTLAELTAGPLVATTDDERAARQAHVQQAEADFERAYDAMIAATALAHGLPVYTCNPDDYAGMDGVRVVTVPLAEE